MLLSIVAALAFPISVIKAATHSAYSVGLSFDLVQGSSSCNENKLTLDANKSRTELDTP